MLKTIYYSLAVVILLATGCATEFNLATGQQESLIYGTEKEVKIGDAVHQQIQKNYEFIYDVDVNERVQRIMDRIVEVCDRKELVYTIRVIDEDQLNAVSLPGGYVYIFKGLIDHIESDDELAGVIAHEVGHITAKHGIKRLQASYGYTLLQIAAIGSGNRELSGGAAAIYTTIFLAHSRQDEFEADRLAVRYTKRAGYDPLAMVNVLKTMKEEQDKDIRPLSYFRTHPHLTERMSVVKSEATGEVEFRDYLNLTGGEGQYRR